ncbi:heterokaryon incompatibility protein [Apiospora arundinis]
MSNSSLHPANDTGAEEDSGTPCKVCKTLHASAKVVKAYNDAGKVPNFNAPINFESKPLNEWIITAEELFNGCDAHQRFLHPYVWRPDDEKLTEIEIMFDRGRLQLYVTFLAEGDDSPWSTSGAELLLLNEEGANAGYALGRRLHNELIDIKLLNHWKETCAGHHGKPCQDKITTLEYPLSYLIDTQQKCLVPAAPNMAYVALSYVWGQVSMLKATQRNLEKLKRPDSLHDLRALLPKTIRDSIALVPLLEERYIWVDSLCIPQDDEEVARRHISQMAAIFENASLTIVACDGHDAEFGLRGLRHSPRLKTRPGILRLAPGVALTARTEVRIRDTPWSQRGWTLQEQIFSRRSLVFFKNTVQWMCRSAKYYEDVDAPPDLPAEALIIDGGETRERLNPLELSLDVPDLSVLSELISYYSRRDLTYQEDVMRAFSSTFGAMQGAFPRGFIHGLPVSFFDASLIWRSSYGRMARRQVSRADAQCPPSWTWAGWKGGFDSCAWTSAYYMISPRRGTSRAHWEAFQVIPMLDWYTKESMDSDEEQRIPFQNEWHNYKSKFMGKEHDLPEGWVYKLREAEGTDDTPVYSKFKEDPECQVTRQELQTPYFYEHESCPGHRFYHPVPLGNNIQNKSDSHKMPDSHGQYLCARTQKAQLWAAKPPWDDQVERAVSCRGPDDFVLRMFGLDLLVSVVLQDQDGAVVGELCPDSQVELESIWDAHPLAIPVDVVVISRGLHFCEPQLVEKETWSFYNVLWVEWVDGIAYRKGVGRVNRSAWERLKKDEISLVLG